MFNGKLEEKMDHETKASEKEVGSRKASIVNDSVTLKNESTIQDTEIQGKRDVKSPQTNGKDEIETTTKLTDTIDTKEDVVTSRKSSLVADKLETTSEIESIATPALDHESDSEKIVNSESKTQILNDVAAAKEPESFEKGKSEDKIDEKHSAQETSIDHKEPHPKSPERRKSIVDKNGEISSFKELSRTSSPIEIVSEKKLSITNLETEASPKDTQKSRSPSPQKIVGDVATSRKSSAGSNKLDSKEDEIELIESFQRKESVPKLESSPIDKERSSPEKEDSSKQSSPGKDDSIESIMSKAPQNEEKKTAHISEKESQNIESNLVAETAARLEIESLHTEKSVSKLESSPIDEDRSGPVKEDSSKLSSPGKDDSIESIMSKTPEKDKEKAVHDSEEESQNIESNLVMEAAVKRGDESKEKEDVVITEQKESSKILESIETRKENEDKSSSPETAVPKESVSEEKEAKSQVGNEDQHIVSESKPVDKKTLEVDEKVEKVHAEKDDDKDEIKISSLEKTLEEKKTHPDDSTGNVAKDKDTVENIQKIDASIQDKNKTEEEPFLPFLSKRASLLGDDSGVSDAKTDLKSKDINLNQEYSHENDKIKDAVIEAISKDDGDKQLMTEKKDADETICEKDKAKDSLEPSKKLPDADDKDKKDEKEEKKEPIQISAQKEQSEADISEKQDNKKEVEGDLDERSHIDHVHEFLTQERMHVDKVFSEAVIKSDKDESQKATIETELEKSPSIEAKQEPTQELIDSNKQASSKDDKDDKGDKIEEEKEEEKEEKGMRETTEKKEQVPPVKETAETVIKTEKIKIDLTDKPEHAESVLLKSTPESPVINIIPSIPALATDIDKMELGRKSPKEREEDVAKIVASVATVLKSDAPLEEFHGKIPLATNTPYGGGYTTELRETHITTCDSPVVESKTLHEEISEPTIQSTRLQDLESSIIVDKKLEEDTINKTDELEDSGTVRRMLVTASSEDGGAEIEICPPGTITFSRSSESSGRSSPENSSRKPSQSSSILDTISDQTTVKELGEAQSKKEAVEETIVKCSAPDLGVSFKDSSATPKLYPNVDLNKEVELLESQIEQPIKQEEKKEEKSEVSEILSEACKEISKDVEDMKETVSDKIGGVFDNIFSSVSKVGEAIGQSISDGAKTVETSIEEGLKKMETGIDEAKHKTEHVESEIIESLAQKKEKAENIVASHLKEFITDVTDAVDKVDETKGSVIEDGKSVLEKISAPLSGVLDDALNKVAESLQSKKDGEEQNTVKAKQEDIKEPDDIKLKESEESNEKISETQKSPQIEDSKDHVEKTTLVENKESIDKISPEKKLSDAVDIPKDSLASIVDTASKHIDAASRVVEDLENGVCYSDATALDEKMDEISKTAVDQTLDKFDQNEKDSKDFFEGIKDDASSLKDSIDEKNSQKVQEVEGIVNGLYEDSKDKVEDDKKLIMEKSSAKIDEIKDDVQSVLESAASTTKDVSDKIESIASDVKKETNAIIDDLKDVEKGLSDNIETQIDSAKTDMGKTLDSEKENVEDSISEIKKSVDSGLAESSQILGKALSSLGTDIEKLSSKSEDAKESGDEKKDSNDVLDEKSEISKITSIVKEEIDSSLKDLIEAGKDISQHESEKVADVAESLKGVKEAVSDSYQSSKETTRKAIDEVGLALSKQSEELVEKGKHELEHKASDIKTEIEGTKKAITEKIDHTTEDLIKAKDTLQSALHDNKESIETSISNIKQEIKSEKDALISTGKEIQSELKHAVDDVFDSGKKLFGGLFGSKKHEKVEKKPNLEEKKKEESKPDDKKPEEKSTDKIYPDLKSETSDMKKEEVEKTTTDENKSLKTLGISVTGDISATCDISKGDVQTHLDVEPSHEKKLSISDVEIFVDDKSKDSFSSKLGLKTANEILGTSEVVHGTGKEEKLSGKDIESTENVTDIAKQSDHDSKEEKHITVVPSSEHSSKEDERSTTPASDIYEFKSQVDPMSMSFYGTLPDEPDTEECIEDVLDKSDVSITHLHDITKAKFDDRVEGSSSGSGDSSTRIPVHDPMTSSFFGELPTSKDTKDPIESWGKPLGLPSPAPPNEKGTPKKERKLPSNVMAKNRINDDRARSESPSKNKKKMNPVYLDLTYVPHHGNSNYAYVDFFKRVRARYYVFSGIEPSRDVYNALLEAKQTWEDKDLEVTIIPTYDTDVLGYWVAENEELLAKYKIDLSPSASRCTINLQDHETSCSAYRLEF
ncbi:hypothetical protein HHI36_017850 [Cryptolaemus montrouzieri]|uniref:Microtubule-associated protein futsch n=1 Tax=Cryptolaemus montrouzieri TaxID=559131 RepID=A0ABD2NPQ8_9CUCU